MIMDEDKKAMIQKVIEAMQSEGHFIQQDKTTSNETKMSQMDVLLDVVHFLENYERNVRILSKYEYEHRMERYKEKKDNERGDL